MDIQIGLHAIVVEQGVVDVEQEDYLVHHCVASAAVPRPIACLAAAATRSAVKPKCSATTFIGADMPKVRMPNTTPAEPA